MKDQYDFSDAEKGKFFRKDAELCIPVYLDPDAFAFVDKIAQKSQADISDIASKLIRTDMQIADLSK